MVMVSHAHRFVFLKTRKTAGTSIEMFLEPFCAPEGHTVTEQTLPILTDVGIVGSRMVKRPDIPAHDGVIWANHMPAAEIRDALGAETFGRYTKITAVRDPFDRALSHFFWRFEMNVTDAASFASVKDAFRAFILKRNWVDDHEIVHIDGAYVADRVIRYETLRDDLDALANDLGLDPARRNLPVTKPSRSRRGDYAISDFYDTETIDAVRTRLAWVFDTFAYPDTPQSAALPA